MPSLGFGEILLILVLALIIFGPRRLPEMGRSAARSLREIRRTTAELKSELQGELDESPFSRIEERDRTTEQPKDRSEAPPEEPASPE